MLLSAWYLFFSFLVTKPPLPRQNVPPSPPDTGTTAWILFFLYPHSPWGGAWAQMSPIGLFTRHTLHVSQGKDSLSIYVILKSILNLIFCCKPHHFVLNVLRLSQCFTFSTTTHRPCETSQQQNGHLSPFIH